MELRVSLLKKFPDFTLDVQFTAFSGITVLFGRSGSGKSTTLNILVGLIKPDQGKISLDSNVFYDSSANINLSPQSRQLGFVFQNHTLFPHLTVLENIAFGLRSGSKKEKLEQAYEKIMSFRLNGQENKLPHQISGGQQQRAALARALISNPQALLLDEPFSAIDGPNKINMRECLKKVMLKLNLPVILVTHDLQEAFVSGNRILIYDKGKIIQQGTPEAIIQNPANKEVCQLLNSTNPASIDFWKNNLHNQDYTM